MARKQRVKHKVKRKAAPKIKRKAVPKVKSKVAPKVKRKVAPKVKQKVVKREAVRRKAIKRKAVRRARVPARKLSPTQKRAQIRAKLSRSLKAYHKRVRADPKLQAQEQARRKKIRRALRKWWQTHTTKRERTWGAKIVAAEKKERRKVRAKIAADAERLSPRDQIMRHLESARALTPVQSMLDYAANADGSLDVELRVAIPRGADGKQILREMAPGIIAPWGTWIAIGWVFSPNADMSRDEVRNYERFHKYLQVHAHFQKGERAAYNIIGALRIHDKLAEAGRRKPEQLFIRVHWSTDGERPE